ncbi:MAG: PKD domain-containing protein [Patescibacteria group bacterium]|nr:PKD domain-containing protein [Patescibacteria group bacterium]MDE1988358.1 PKD domain-containing protein [Patescibacteria group bacterium]MDE2218392.1 PKD domain-containing protein [Patescibacteria group bacterium]
MNVKIEMLFLTSIICALIAVFSFSASAYASEAPLIANYKLNGKEESAKFNPSRNNVVSIEINANVPVKFNTIALCSSGDVVCSRTTAVKYFTQTADFALSVSRDWDGKTSKGMAVQDGDYKIKATIKDESGAENIQELSPYAITVDLNYGSSSGGSSSSSSSSKNSSSESQSAPQADYSVAANSGDSYFISTHSSPENLSSSISSARFEANSGRNRLAYAGAPINFDGTAAIPKDLYGQSVKFIWSFGDGSVAEGKKVSHTYNFAGDYIVVLNASLSDISAVSRTSVKVVSPSVTISNVSGDSVEVWNKGIYEINLNGWIISNDREKFIFPTDTIIWPNKKIAFPNEYMKLNLVQNGKVSLLNPLGKEASIFSGDEAESSSSPTLAVNSSNLDNDPVVIKVREFIAKGGKSFVDGNIAQVSRNNLNAQVVEASVSPDEKSIAENKKDAVFENGEIISSSTQTAAIAPIQSPPRGFVRNFLNLPSVGFNLIKRMFYSGE